MPWSVFDDLWTVDPYWWRGPRTSSSRPFPAVNVYGDDVKLIVTSEIPGLRPDDLDIKVHGRTLTINGKRTLPELGEDECFSCQERTRGEFSRSVTLPYMIEPDKIEAKYERGVLAIHLPRVESDKPRKITVKAA